MANNKMLIDASHPEETRVVVIRGNRIEEFDFEAQERRQLRGNIYLAKVTRVEPSLQAAFIDYGGNRHGFLAFSEIHPDYYQIPAADRQALLDAEEEEASRETDSDDEVSVVDAVGDGDGDDTENGDNEEEAKPKKRGRRRSRRGGNSKKAQDTDSDDAGDSQEEAAAAGDDHGEVTAAQNDGEKDSTEESEVKKPKRRSRRTKKAATESDESSDDSSSDDEDAKESGGNSSMAAMMEMDTISEPVADEPEDAGEDESEEAESGSTGDEDAPKKKPKRAPRRKAASSKKAEVEKTEKSDSSSQDENAGSSDPGQSDEDSDETAEKKPRKTAKSRRGSRKKSESAEENSTGEEAKADAGDDDGEDDSPKAKPKGRKKSGRKGKDEAEEIVEGNGGNGEKVESVGQEDALEEVPVRRPRRQYKIQEVIRRRQVMLVQVVKEERGNKGAALTTYLSLAGRYSVLMPNTARGGGISRKITNPGDRKRLKEIAGALDVPKGMGVILRTAGASRDKEEINRDFEYLMRLWENVRNLTLESSAPFLVYEEGSLIKRSIRDLYNKDIGEIIVAGEDGYQEACNFMQMMMPEHVKNVKLYKGEQSLLSKFNVEGQLEKMVTPQVTLKSGGYLIINQTEALVAIDVNSGRSTREHSIEATALQTNLEAAEEVARQLRLRDLAGLVVIDFIDMEEKRNNRAVERKLKDCLKNDRARIQVGHISHFGLLEMSRQRIRASVLESTMAVCPVCEGVGHVRSESSFAIHVLRAVDDHLNRNSRFDVVVQVAPSTALYILNHKRQAVSELEDRYGVSVEFVGDYLMQVQDFEISKGDQATRPASRQKAINPMHADDNADDDADQAEEPDASRNDEDDNNGRKRGRRRRGRGRDRDRDGKSEDSRDNNSRRNGSSADDVDSRVAANNADVEADASNTADKADKAETTKRGKRKSGETRQDAEKEKADIKAPVVVEEESDSRAPRRRTGRPGKKVKSEAENGAEESREAAKETPSTGPAGAPPRKIERRNTRRVRTPKEEPTETRTDDNAPESFGDGFLS